MKKIDGLVLSAAELFVFIRDIVIVAGKRNTESPSLFLCPFLTIKKNEEGTCARMPRFFKTRSLT